MLQPGGRCPGDPSAAREAAAERLKQRRALKEQPRAPQLQPEDSGAPPDSSDEEDLTKQVTQLWQLHSPHSCFREHFASQGSTAAPGQCQSCAVSSYLCCLTKRHRALLISSCAGLPTQWRRVKAITRRPNPCREAGPPDRRACWLPSCNGDITGHALHERSGSQLH